MTASNPAGLTPLHAAAQHGHADLVAPLLRAGADVNASTTVRAYLSLKHAARLVATCSLRCL